MWRFDIPPTEEMVIVSIRDDSGDTPYCYTYVGWYFNGYWVVDNSICTQVVAWMELPPPIIQVTK